MGGELPGDRRSGEGIDRGGIDPGVIELASRVFELARAGEAEQVAAYVDAGVPVNLTNGPGDSLLMLAAYHTHLPLVRALLERGADPNRVNDRGQSILGAAVFRQSRDIVTLLLQAGGDPELGRQSARATAQFFDLPEMAALLPPAP